MAEAIESLERNIRTEAMASLRTFLGDPEARRVWGEACSTCGLCENAADLSLENLESIALQLKASEGPAALVGHSLTIRVRTYRLLAQAQRLDDFMEGGRP